MWRGSFRGLESSTERARSRWTPGRMPVDPCKREQKQRNDEKPGALHDADVQLAVVGKGPGAEAHAASLEPAVHDGGEDRPAETERLTSVQRDGKGRGPDKSSCRIPVAM